MSPQEISTTFTEAQRCVAEGKLDQAARLLQQILDQEESLEPLHLLGAIAYEKKNYSAAAAIWRKTVALDPNNGERWHLLGQSLVRLEKWDEAAEALRKAISLDEDLLESHLGLADVLCRIGDYAAAREQCERCLAADPTYPQAHIQLGTVLAKSGAFAEAQAHFKSGMDHADTESNSDAIRARGLCNSGAAYFDGNQDAQAIAAYTQALALDPDFAEAKWDRALAKLRSGDFVSGLVDYEARWGTEQFRPSVRKFKEPYWDGSPLDGKTLLVCGEQGYGDVMEYARFAAEVAQKQKGRVVMLVRPALQKLIATTPGVAEVVAEATPLPHFDCWVNLMSLPLLLGVRSPKDVPSHVPYLFPDKQLAAEWKETLGPRKSARRVGLVWATKTPDPQRLIPLQKLAPLTALKNIEFVSLQVEQKFAQELAAAGLPIANYSSRLTSFAQTAALVDCLDLVISIDTSVIHVAGATGKPIWVMLPWSGDWRWEYSVETTYWYPQMRLFRQTVRAQWDDVVERVRGELEIAVRDNRS